MFWEEAEQGTKLSCPHVFAPTSPCVRKTTAMLFKMFGIEKAWHQIGNSEGQPRQMFVTKSRHLAEKVEEYFMQFITSLSKESYVPQHALDLLQRWDKRDRRGLINVEEDNLWRCDLPQKFSELSDENFPLFITIDGVSIIYLCWRCMAVHANYLKLCSLVEADLACEPRTRQTGRPGARRNSYVLSSKQHSNRPISFHTFKNDYWEHFPQSLTKRLSQSAFYDQDCKREIIIFAFSSLVGFWRVYRYIFPFVSGKFNHDHTGVIQGSQATLNLPRHVLDSKTYINLSNRMYPTFVGKREVVYTLFEAYMQRKAARGERDSADRQVVLYSAVSCILISPLRRMHAVLDGVGAKNLMGRKVDFL
jgi:hypothetical protein